MSIFDTVTLRTPFGLDVLSICILALKRHFAESRGGMIMAGIVMNDEDFADGDTHINPS